MIEVFIAGVLLGLAVGGTGMWIREKNAYIRYSEKRIAEARRNNSV